MSNAADAESTKKKRILQANHISSILNVNPIITSKLILDLSQGMAHELVRGPKDHKTACYQSLPSRRMTISEGETPHPASHQLIKKPKLSDELSWKIATGQSICEYLDRYRTMSNGMTGNDTLKHVESTTPGMRRKLNYNSIRLLPKVQDSPVMGESKALAIVEDYQKREAEMNEKIQVILSDIHFDRMMMEKIIHQYQEQAEEQSSKSTQMKSEIDSLIEAVQGLKLRDAPLDREEPHDCENSATLLACSAELNREREKVRELQDLVLALEVQISTLKHQIQLSDPASTMHEIPPNFQPYVQSMREETREEMSTKTEEFKPTENKNETMSTTAKKPERPVRPTADKSDSTEKFRVVRRNSSPAPMSPKMASPPITRHNQSPSNVHSRRTDTLRNIQEGSVKKLIEKARHMGSPGTPEDQAAEKPPRPPRGFKVTPALFPTVPPSPSPIKEVPLQPSPQLPSIQSSVSGYSTSSDMSSSGLLQSANSQSPSSFRALQTPANTPAPPKHKKEEKRRILLALFDYAAKQTDELDFLDGDLLRYVDESSDGWILAELYGKTGYIPSNFVFDLSLVTPRKMVGLSDFEGECEGDLTFKRGTMVDVLNQEDDWWIAQADGAVGYVPRNFLGDKS
ncbi:hypothetical protein PROFUN_05746 [Planoprotostelium fungivorum]|uniref:SH3 domain-containing protein n=1 Tax=Planoprotostelium fungivorum TaxID=1890364 RepID=A0A2P6NQK0_9EUKA|nr:hypothetical protein PROFUN_05746 [Planoprotostelium fungivorum]